MYVHRREREHEEVNELVREDPNDVATLMQCGLLKFFLCPFMRAQPRLLNTLVNYWHSDAEAFMLEGQSLVPTVKEIYFLSGLSRRGEPVNFWTFPARPHNITELIGLYCVVDTDCASTEVLIRNITNLSLQVIVFLIGRIIGSVALHQASHAQMNCVVQCLNVHVFDWSTTLLECMKRQLTDYRFWTHRNFGFRTILCSLFFERVLCFSPRVVV
jgi:hypothetical protein